MKRTLIIAFLAVVVPSAAIAAFAIFQVSTPASSDFLLDNSSDFLTPDVPGEKITAQ